MVYRGVQRSNDMPQLVFDHIHLRTSDIEGMADWFGKMLGAEVIRSMPQGVQRIDIKVGGQMIFLMPIKPGETVNPAPVTPYRGLDHFAYAVKDIDALFADLKAKGAEFSQELRSQRPGLKMMLLRGPEGISVELLQRDAQ
jgi:catechol 2,3-dioxygenase-like lactoylglutathione lyase family enzyme